MLRIKANIKDDIRKNEANHKYHFLGKPDTRSNPIHIFKNM